MEEIISGQGYRREIWCGDFNAHKNLWGSKHTDKNDEVVGVMMEVSNNLANSCEWNVKDDASIGRDHFPIICSFNV